MEEFKTNFHHKSGATNAVADALSRVPIKLSEIDPQEAPVEVSNKSIYCMFETNPDMAECLSYDPDIAECFLEHPVFDAEVRLPFQFETLADYQAKSKNCWLYLRFILIGLLRYSLMNRS